jgi:RimJ/RimL family protein N-acetyltransferase
VLPRPDTIRLRPVERADLPTLFLHQLDAESCRMAVVRPRDRAAFNATWDKILADPTVIARAILADDTLVGSISCFKMDGLDSVGYWIDRAHWNRGIAGRALALLLQEVTIRPLHAHAARNNVASIRVLERCGFRITRHQVSPETDRFPSCEEAILILD